MATSKHNRSIKLKIEATLPMPEVQQKTLPTKQSCTDCGRCGSNGPMKIAGETLLKTASGEYSEEQIEGALEIVAAALRRYYSKQ